jgi:hypothetical protein
MRSSVGVMAATLTCFLFNKETQCNFFVWCQRHLGLRTGKPNPAHEKARWSKGVQPRGA